MRLVMVGLDYTTAAMEIRDAFAPDVSAHRDILRGMMGGDVRGCVLIATCNRTELYVSHQGDVPPDGVELLCRALGKDGRRHRPHFVERHERQAVEHLMRVAAGMRSSVPGDDQVLSQARAALETAREAETADPLLEALFRAATTAGKKVKTQARFTRDGSSIAQRTAVAAARFFGSLDGRRALVIGNGTIACLTAAALAGRGCGVSMTLRDPRRRESLPAGCAVVDYADRIDALAECDVAISATSSPSHTLLASDLSGGKSLPGLFIDLAVPRDIDPAVGGLPGVALWNVDDLGGSGEDDEALRLWLAKADAVVLEEAERFDLWRRNRLRLARAGSGSPDFPIFINLCGASVLIAGGGRVAARRAEKLLGFGARVRVVSPRVGPEMEKLLGRDGLNWTRDVYDARHLDGVTLAIAATDSREANATVGRDARERGVLVSVADRRQECTFYFPAIVRSDLLTAGLISNNGDHGMVRRAAVEIREEMETIDADYQGGKPREPFGRDTGPLGHGVDTALSS